MQKTIRQKGSRKVERGREAREEKAGLEALKECEQRGSRGAWATRTTERNWKQVAEEAGRRGFMIDPGRDIGRTADQHRQAQGTQMTSETITDIQIHQLLPPLLSMILTVPLGPAPGTQPPPPSSLPSAFDLRARAADILARIANTFGPSYANLVPRTSATLPSHSQQAPFKLSPVHHLIISPSPEQYQLTRQG